MNNVCEQKCNCNIELMEQIINAVVSKNRKPPYECDKDGNPLFYVDSFGYRDLIPGETRECYKDGAKCYMHIMRKNKKL